MPSLTVRNIDEELKKKLKLSPASRNRSMEEEVRQILKHYLLREKSGQGIGTRISRRFAQAGGVELPDAKRTFPREKPDFGRDEPS